MLTHSLAFETLSKIGCATHDNMIRLFKWAIALVSIFAVAYAAFSFFQRFRNLPELPDGAYTIRFDDGFRAIVLNANVPNDWSGNEPWFLRSLTAANRTRQYIAVTYQIPTWFEDAWSYCESPAQTEMSLISNLPADTRSQLEHARFEYVCRINVDGADILRGLLFSVPRL